MEAYSSVTLISVTIFYLFLFFLRGVGGEVGESPPELIYRRFCQAGNGWRVAPSIYISDLGRSIEYKRGRENEIT